MAESSLRRRISKGIQKYYQIFFRHYPTPYPTDVITTLPVSMISNQCMQKTYPVHTHTIPHSPLSQSTSIQPPWDRAATKKNSPHLSPQINLLLPTSSPHCYHHKQSGAASKRYAPPAFSSIFFVNISNSKVIHVRSFYVFSIWILSLQSFMKC